MYFTVIFPPLKSSHFKSTVMVDATEMYDIIQSHKLVLQMLALDELLDVIWGFAQSNINVLLW